MSVTITKEIEKTQTLAAGLKSHLDEVGKHGITADDIQEMSVPEIATIIDIPEGTVKSRLHTLTNYLRLKLKDYE